MPQITCPKCGTTINLENRKTVDYSRILHALQKNPKTFTELLKITDLPRKTLSLRLRTLCDSGVIFKDNGYHLNGNSPKMLGAGTLSHQPLSTQTDWKRLLRMVTLMLILTLSTGSIVSALMVTRPGPPPLLPPVASFITSPEPPYYVRRFNALTFDASSSYDHDGNITSYKWKFFLSQEQEGLPRIDVGGKEGMITTYAFSRPGHYMIVLTVMDNDGKSTSCQSDITIHPAPCEKLYVCPLSVNKTIGDTFTVGIAIRDVADLSAWQFGMTFNPKVLECLTVNITTFDEEGNIVPGVSAFEEGPFLKQGGATLFLAPRTIYNREGAIVYHGCILFPINTTVTPVSGSGILAYVTFKVIGHGESPLHLTDVMLLNNDGLEIPILNLEDGCFQSP